MIGTGEVQQAVGALLFRWSHLERVLRETLQDAADRKVPHGISQCLDLWAENEARSNPENAARLAGLRAELNAALEMRNRFCHGLHGLEGSVDADPAEAHVRTELNGTERNYSLREIEETTRRIDAIARFRLDYTRL